MKRSRPIVATLALAVLATAACGSGGTAASGAGAPQSTKTLTSDDLKRALLSVADVPGYQLEQDPGPSASGYPSEPPPSMNPTPHGIAPSSTNPGCDDATEEIFDIGPDTPDAPRAAVDYATSSGDSTIDQVIVSGGSDATKYFSDLRSRLLGCTTWSITRRSRVTTTSISPVTSPKVGDDMIAISITTTRTKDGSKDVSTVVAVRVGNIMSSIIKDGNQPGPEINAMVTKTVDRIKGLTPAR